MNKVILLAGASSGIGFASAKRLIKDGHLVYCGARRLDLMSELADQGAKVVELDVAKDDSVHQVVQQIIADQGRIDGVFFNAGYCLLGPVELASMAEIERQFNVNVFGNGRVLQAVLPQMRKQRSGTIVITSSAAGHVSTPGLGWYAATKHAQQAIGDALRMEVKGFGIKVALIEPGYINSDIDNASFPTLDVAENSSEAAEYRQQMQTFRSKWGKGIDSGSSPDTIAKVVSQAFAAKNPKRRYHPNVDAKFAIFSKRFLGQAVLDTILPKATIE